MSNKTAKDYGINIRPNISKHIDLLVKRGYSYEELSFLNDAVEQVIENRQILTWSYVYGYFLAKKESTNKLFDEQRSYLNHLTEDLQDNLENKLDTV